MANKSVFITGASGTMGWASFKEIYDRRPDLDINVLLRDSEKNRKLFAPYLGDERVKIVWGDFEDYDAIKKCVDGTSYVLHIGGLVSPAADYWPKKTFKVNTTAAEYIVKAVKAQKNPDDIIVVYIGTVAQTGNRPDPIHWARTGDPIKTSIYDHYAVSKTMAEAIFAESGLKKWVSMRQSGILYPEIVKNMDPIMFHVPLNGVLEWATVEDSATLMCNVCSDDLPDDFFRRFYNIGSGPDYRLTNYEFEDYLLNTIGMGHNATKKLFSPNWFITKNFHGQWYADSQVLEDYLHFRHNTPVDAYFSQILGAGVPGVYKLSGLAANPIGKFFMKRLALDKRFGTLTWVKNQDKNRLTAFFGSLEDYNKIPDSWDNFKIYRPSDEPTYLDHGYDEKKKTSDLDINDMKKAAEFRGGECLSKTMKKGDLDTPLQWKCQFGHEFEMSPNLVLKGGHWCPECLPLPWNYDEIAKGNPFFAQVWTPDHDKDEHNVYDWDIYSSYDEFAGKPEAFNDVNDVHDKYKYGFTEAARAKAAKEKK